MSIAVHLDPTMSGITTILNYSHVSSLLLIILVVIFDIPNSFGGFFKAGPFKLRLKEFGECEDVGTGELRFDLRQHLLPSGELAFSGTVTLPQDLDENVHGQVDIAQWGAGGWAPNAYTRRSPDLCSELRRMATGYFASLASALQVEPRCPLPRGRYTLTDWQVDMSVPFPMLPYGHYRIDVGYSNDTARLGCVRWILDCVKR